MPPQMHVEEVYSGPALQAWAESPREEVSGPFFFQKMALHGTAQVQEAGVDLGYIFLKMPVTPCEARNQIYIL